MTKLARRDSIALQTEMENQINETMECIRQGKRNLCFAQLPQSSPLKTDFESFLEIELEDYQIDSKSNANVAMNNPALPKELNVSLEELALSSPHELPNVWEDNNRDEMDRRVPETRRHSLKIHPPGDKLELDEVHLIPRACARTKHATNTAEPNQTHCLQRNRRSNSESSSSLSRTQRLIDCKQPTYLPIARKNRLKHGGIYSLLLKKRPKERIQDQSPVLLDEGLHADLHTSRAVKPSLESAQMQMHSLLRALDEKIVA